MRGRSRHRQVRAEMALRHQEDQDRKSTRLNSSHGYISYAVFCLKKKKKHSATDSHNTVIPAHTRAGLQPIAVRRFLYLSVVGAEAGGEDGGSADVNQAHRYSRGH